jgi:hypothetical protein
MDGEPSQYPVNSNLPIEGIPVKASIRLVAMMSGLALLLVACSGTAIEPVDNTSTTSGDTRTTTTTPAPAASTQAPACSADELDIGAEAPQGDLPALVAAMRADLLAASTACDFGRLGAMAEANGTSYTFGGDTDPGAFWRDLEANGETPLADMVQLLNLEPALFDVGEGIVFYVWPAVYALPDWADATGEQRQELAGIFGTDQLAGWDSFGGYVGYRVGITTDGRWSFFVAGD